MKALLQQIADHYGLTLKHVQQLKWAMVDEWSDIGYDYLSLFESERAAILLHGSEAAMIAEATVDADRLRRHGDMGWFYDLEGDIIKLAEEVWAASW